MNTGAVTSPCPESDRGVWFAERVAAPAPARRHDLDALRAVAMLLGIVVHGALSFTPLPWPVQDSRQDDLFGVLFAAIHGFRMPLFFLLSGFFTAMLWRQHGLRQLLRHRFCRVFLPCMAGLFTIVPAVGATAKLAKISASDSTALQPADERLLEHGSLAKVESVELASEQKQDGPYTLASIARWLMRRNVFRHLWFLWFLCWLVGAFAIYAAFASRLRWTGPPKWLLLSPIRFLWLLPMTMALQSLMGADAAGFGPVTSAGLLPRPSVLLYYTIFFGFGALYFDCNDVQGYVGRLWPITLSVGLLVVFPLGLDLATGYFGWRDQLADPRLHPLLAVALQAAYAWLMTFGLMGLFRAALSREYQTMRYLSDSSYWLYLAHLPLVFLAQTAVRSWPLPAPVKFFIVCGTVTALLLLSYQAFVRYTWLGSFLNGPRKRPTLVERTQPAQEFLQ